MIGQFLFSQQF